MLEGGSGFCVQTRAKICDPAPGGVLEGGGPGGVPPPATAAAVSKHETGTVTKRTTCALQFMVAFALPGGGGATAPGIYLTSLCPGRREVCPR